jgi:hypothetical protein
VEALASAVPSFVADESDDGVVLATLSFDVVSSFDADVVSSSDADVVLGDDSLPLPMKSSLGFWHPAHENETSRPETTMRPRRMIKTYLEN